MPNALTIAATPSPVVSATAPTASGVVSATAVPWPGRAMDQRLQQQPLADEPGAQRQPGRAERGDAEQYGGRRHPAGQPAEPVQVTQPGGGQHRAGRQESRHLKAACATRCSSAAATRPPPAVVRPWSANSDGRAQRERDQPHVLGRGVGEQPFEVGGHRGLQDAVDRRDGRRRRAATSPTSGRWPEQLQVDPDDAVDAEVDHRRAHQRRHRAGRLRVRARQPRMQRHQARLRAEPGDREHEHHGRGRRRAPQPGPVNRSAPAAPPQHHQPDQDRDKAELGHHGVKQRGRTDFGAMVLGEHQDQRCRRPSAPSQ